MFGVVHREALASNATVGGLAASHAAAPAGVPGGARVS